MNTSTKTTYSKVRGAKKKVAKKVENLELVGKKC